MPKFLRLNDANPSALRPLRVEDLQDIWDAVANTLSQSVNTPVIVSGFSYVDALLDPNAPLTSGVVAYNGKLYAYNADETPLRLGARAYLHDNVPTDDQRQLSDGTIQTFSFKSVVNADPANGIGMGELTANAINLMRSAYIAPRAVTGANIALQTVARKNLVRNFAPVVSAGSSVRLPQNAYLDDFIRFVDDHWEVNAIGFDNGTILSLYSNNDDLDQFPDTFSVYVNADTTSKTLNIRANVGIPVTQIVSALANKGTILTFGRVSGGYALIASNVVTPD